MSHVNTLNRRKELGVACIVGALGHIMCFGGHQCICGHLKHGRHVEVFPWIVDVLWLSAFILAAIVGIRSRFSGAKLTGIFALSVIGLNASVLPSLAPLGPLVSIPFLIIGVIHLFLASKENNSILNKANDDEAQQDETQ